MKRMGHPYIVKLIEIIDDPQQEKQYLILEYVKNKDSLPCSLPPPFATLAQQT